MFVATADRFDVNSREDEVFNVSTIGKWSVIESTPVFHHSTDGYVGEHRKPVFVSDRMTSALCRLLTIGMSEEQVDFDDRYYFLRDPKGNARGWSDFERVTSGYTGIREDDSIPF